MGLCNKGINMKWDIKESKDMIKIKTGSGTIKVRPYNTIKVGDNVSIKCNKKDYKYIVTKINEDNGDFEIQAIPKKIRSDKNG